MFECEIGDYFVVECVYVRGSVVLKVVERDDVFVFRRDCVCFVVYVVVK